jgi:hypothetical protein
VLFVGSAVLLALLWGGGTEHPTRRALAQLAPAQLSVDLSPRPTPLSFVVKRPVDVKSIKVMGATGIGAFLPVADDFAFGAAMTTFRLTPTHRAVQVVAGIRFRF